MIIIVSGILPTTTIMTTSMPMVWDAITFTSRMVRIQWDGIDDFFFHQKFNSLFSIKDLR